jgi:UDP-N-acetylglucosamine 2-epimerase (non-hydrolysing)
MPKLQVDIIAGTRPNFVKIAALYSALSKENKFKNNFSFRLIHTGQHYDFNMSESFFDQLGLPSPDYNFGVGGGTHAKQTGSIMEAYEGLLFKGKPDLCVVVGDVNSTLACALAAKKMNVPLAHIEGGIRSGDRSMPEEINRLATDAISDYFFTTSEHASNNLLGLGISSKNIFFVGNTMIDTLKQNIPNFQKPYFFEQLKLISKEFILITLHRPSNVDNDYAFDKIIEGISVAAEDIPIIYPVHPRIKVRLLEQEKKPKNLHIVDSLPYLQFNWLLQNSMGVVTDSGGITEEATFMGIPCITMRENTERPETVEVGTNVLIGQNTTELSKLLSKIKNREWKDAKVPHLWDGHAGRRILEVLLTIKLT